MTYTQCERCHTYLRLGDISFGGHDDHRTAKCPKCGYVRRLSPEERCETVSAIIDRERRLRERGIMPWDTKRTADLIKVRKEVEKEAREHARAEAEEARAKLDADPEWQAKRAKLREEAERRIREKAGLPPEAPLLESVPETEPAPIPTETIAKPLTIKKSTLDIWM